MEVRFAHLANAIEATVTVRVVTGSNDFKARFTARTDSIDDEMVLLDSRSSDVAITATVDLLCCSAVSLSRRIGTY